MDNTLLPNLLHKFGARKRLESLTYCANWLIASPKYCLNAAGERCKSGDSVATWSAHPASVGAGHFSQATGSLQPIYHGEEKFPFVRFDGVDDVLRHAGTISADTTGALILVARWLGNATRTPVSSADEAGTAIIWCILDAGGTPKLDVRKDNNQATDDRYQYINTLSSQRSYPGIFGLYDVGSAWVGKCGDVTQVMANVTGVNTGSQMWGSVSGRDNWTLGALQNSGGASSFCNFDLFEAMWITAGVGNMSPIDTAYEYLKGKYKYKTIAHLGDSWAADTGYGNELRANLAADWIFVADHGVGSETMAQIGTRFDSDVDNKGYDLVIVEGAINDLKAVSAGQNEAVFVEFRRICDGVLADGSKLIACNCGPFGNNNQWSQTRQNETMEYNRKVYNYCQAKNVPLIDLYDFAVNKDQAMRAGVNNSVLAGQPYAFRPDWELTGGLHFNAVGDAFIASHLADVVRKTLGTNN